MTIKKGKLINVQVYKHNGTLYKQWNGVKVIKLLPNIIVLLMYKSKVSELSKQKWIVKEPTFWFFPIKNKFYNTTALIRKSGIFFYNNLASSPVFEDNTLKFIDYDLDVKLYPKLSIQIVDKLEYERHKIKYSYSPKLIKKIQLTLEELIKSIKNKEKFFNDKIIYSYVDDLIKDQILTKKIIKN